MPNCVIKHLIRMGVRKKGKSGKEAELINQEKTLKHTPVKY